MSTTVLEYPAKTKVVTLGESPLNSFCTVLDKVWKTVFGRVQEIVLQAVLKTVFGRILNSLGEGPRKSSGSILESVFGSLRKSLWESPGKCLETGSEPVLQRALGHFFNGVLWTVLYKVLGKVLERVLRQAWRQIRKEPKQESCKYYWEMFFNESLRLGKSLETVLKRVFGKVLKRVLRQVCKVSWEMFLEECWESSGKSLEQCLGWNFHISLGKSWLMFGTQFRRVLESVLRNVLEESETVFGWNLGTVLRRAWRQCWKVS